MGRVQTKQNVKTKAIAFITPRFPDKPLARQSDVPAVIPQSGTHIQVAEAKEALKSLFFCSNYSSEKPLLPEKAVSKPFRRAALTNTTLHSGKDGRGLHLWQ